MIVYLYIKIHNITGLKYFGKTTQDPFRYLGSGKYWKRHIKKHGSNITTKIYGEFYNDDILLSEVAIKFSEENNIVKSKEWANLTIENGKDGGNTRIGMSKEKYLNYCNNISKANKNRPKSAATKKLLSDIRKNNPTKTFGMDNGRALHIQIFDSNDNLIFNCEGSYIKVCKNNGLSHYTVKKSFTNNEKFYASGKGINTKFEGWYAKKIN